MLKHAAFIAVALFAVAPGAHAAMRCSFDDISKTFFAEEQGAVCRVYYKASDDKAHAVWQANSGSGLCRDKVAAYGAMLSESGWRCIDSPADDRS